SVAGGSSAWWSTTAPGTARPSWPPAAAPPGSPRRPTAGWGRPGAPGLPAAPPGELERLAAPILEGRADYVVGSRFAGEIRRMLPQRRLGNLALTALLRFVARTPIGDGQSGFRALSRAAAADAEIVHDYNYAQVLTLDLLAKGHRYLEVPIGYRFRSTGRALVRPLRSLRRVVPAMWRELNRPGPGPGSVLDHVGGEALAGGGPGGAVEGAVGA